MCVAYFFKIPPDTFLHIYLTHSLKKYFDITKVLVTIYSVLILHKCRVREELVLVILCNDAILTEVFRSVICITCS